MPEVSSVPARGPTLAALLLVVLLSGALVARYYDRTWWPPDDGNYAHVADRLLSGETLHADVQDPHAGYVNFLHAGAFAVFGTNLVSLRYPLAVLSVIQAALMFFLMRPRGLATAIVGASTFTALGFIQVTTPTANWYALFSTVCTIGWLSWVPPGARHRDLGTGVLLGITFLLRQLSGVLLGIGVVLFLLIERPQEAERRGLAAARALIVVMAGGIVGYLARATDAMGWTLFGVWPLLLLAVAWRRVSLPNREALSLVARLSIGAVAAALPLIGYHVAHHSIGPWLDDAVGAASGMTTLEFLRLPGYTLTGILALHGLAHGLLAERVNGLFWLTMLVLAPLLALALMAVMRRREPLEPLPIVALVYALVSVHYQVTLYLFYSAGISLAALIWLASGAGRALRGSVLAVAAIMAVVAVYYQAGMPLSRGLRGTVAGERTPVDTRLQLRRGGLLVERADAERYEKLVSLIQRESEVGDGIFAFPGDAELYFLGERRNPFPFFSTALGIRSARDLDTVLAVLRCRSPKLIFYEPDDKYNTVASRRIAAEIRATYDSLPPIPPFEIYRPRLEQPAQMEQQAGCRPRGGA